MTPRHADLWTSRAPCPTPPVPRDLGQHLLGPSRRTGHQKQPPSWASLPHYFYLPSPPSVRKLTQAPPPRSLDLGSTSATVPTGPTEEVTLLHRSLTLYTCP